MQFLEYIGNSRTATDCSSQQIQQFSLLTHLLSDKEASFLHTKWIFIEKKCNALVIQSIETCHDPFFLQKIVKLESSVEI